MVKNLINKFTIISGHSCLLLEINGEVWSLDLVFFAAVIYFSFLEILLMTRLEFSKEQNFINIY